jgi:Cu(I)/Ag(I) efflux system membrane protein CusA/SilA
MVEKHGNSSETITEEVLRDYIIYGSARLRPKLMTVSVALFGLVPILWSTGTGADVMIPLQCRLLGNDHFYHLCIISNTCCFEMTKLRIKNKR